MLEGRVCGAAALGLALALLACQEPAPPVIFIPTEVPAVATTPAAPRGTRTVGAARPEANATSTAATPTRPRGTPGASRSGPRSPTPTADAARAADPCLAGQASRTPPRPECAVKGNINAQGERIYHLPGVRVYDQAEIDPARGERWFRSAEEAEQAGWRRARQ